VTGIYYILNSINSSNEFQTNKFKRVQTNEFKQTSSNKATSNEFKQTTAHMWLFKQTSNKRTKIEHSLVCSNKRLQTNETRPSLDLQEDQVTVQRTLATAASMELINVGRARISGYNQEHH